ncbi:MAG: methyltransferase domain-containing protein [Thermoplasmata archaeon]
MRYMFELSGEHPELPTWEAESVLSCFGKMKVLEEERGIAILSSDATCKEIVSRISLSHFISEHLKSTEIDGLESAFLDLDVPRCSSVAVRVKLREDRRRTIDASRMMKSLGAIISKKARVRLENPDVTLRVYIGDRAHIGLQLAEIDRSQFEKRKNRFLPYTSPVSIHPRLARTLINLTAASRDAKILDPFCGTGSILIEAAMMGFPTFGSDISEDMIEGARRNLRHLGLKSELRQLDVSKISEFGTKFDCIVTDPPYGRSSSTGKEPLGELYSRALSSFIDNLNEKGRVGIILPNGERLAYEDDFVLLRSTSVRVHRSLTRNFFVLRRK